MNNKALKESFGCASWTPESSVENQTPGCSASYQGMGPISNYYNNL